MSKSPTPKQRRFIAEYLKDLNGKQAAIRAGYSPKSAESTASVLLTDPKVSQAVAAGKAKQLEAADLSAIRVLEELRRLGFSDIGGLFDAQGQLKPVGDLSPELRSAVASVKTLKTNITSGDGAQETTREVKLWDKVRALETLAKHFALLTEQVQHTGELKLTWQS